MNTKERNMGIKDNNGDAISCIVLMVHDLACKNNSSVAVETSHDPECMIHEMFEDREASNNEINTHHPTAEEARRHLYSCDCDPYIELVFERGDGETLLVEFRLSDCKKDHHWLGDRKETKSMLELGESMLPSDIENSWGEWLEVWDQVGELHTKRLKDYGESEVGQVAASANWRVNDEGRRYWEKAARKFEKMMGKSSAFKIPKKVYDETMH